MISFQFLYPWLLVLLIPALLVTLIPHFKIKKRYRRTRNRIISLVLRIIVFVFAITMLAGMTISYTIPNDGNEIILLVDISDNIDETYAVKRDDCVDNIIFGVKENLKGAKLGIVTFGYDQKYVAELSNDIDEVYDAYVMTELTPDTSATNIAAALRYAKTLFTEEATWRKIILVSDGKETDEVATKTIQDLVADEEEMFVDVVDVTTAVDVSDAQIISVEMPSYHITPGDLFEINVNVQSNSTELELALTMSDNDVENANANPAPGEKGDPAVVTAISNGTTAQKLTMQHVFDVGGLHKLTFTLSDGASEGNNVYTVYYYIDIFNNVLILEGNTGDSDNLDALLQDEMATVDGAYETTVITLTDATYEQLPKSVYDLRQYDQVILNNVSNDDFAIADEIIYNGDFAASVTTGTVDDYSNYLIGLLYTYVYEYGGGLLTVGGNDVQGNASVYNRELMKGTLYQQMLPVQVIDYTPPVGVMLIVDISGSMSNKLQDAREGAYAVLSVLTERDYIGIMTLDTNYSTVLEMTSVMYKDVIRAKIDTLQKATGSTNFANAIQRAGQSLAAMTQVAKRHIVIVTDGQPGEKESDYLPYAEQFYRNNGTTISVVMIGSGNTQKVQNLCNAAGGAEAGSIVYTVAPSQVAQAMMSDINAPAIKEVANEPFNPTIADLMSPLTEGFETLEDFPNKMLATLGGFYGTKLKAGAQIILTGDYDVPVYAQWAFGEGMVGSFMIDLKGSGDSFATEFMADRDGVQFIYNVVANLMPNEDIRPSEMVYEFTEDNYTNSLTVYNTLAEGEYIKAEIYSPAGTNGAQDVLVMSLNAMPDPEQDVATLDYYVINNFTANEEGYNTVNCNFVFKKSGVYRIDITKYAADGTPTALATSIYKSFAYSEEYDIYYEENAGISIQENLMALAEGGNGIYLADLEEVDSLLNAKDTLTLVWDPRLLFMILTIIFMLIDVAVRKFKFKWIHEIIREKKLQKARQK